MIKDYWELKDTANFFRDKQGDPLVLEAILKVTSGGKDAVDIGCGGGRNSKILIDNDFNVFLIDKYENMLGTAVDYLSYKKENISGYKTEDISNLKLPNNVFDIALCIGVLHQNESESSTRACLESIYNSLKDGGIFVYNVFTSDYIDNSLTDLGEHRYQTNENAPMILLSKEFYLNTFKELGFKNVYEQYDVKDVNTGKRAIIRGLLKK